VGEETECSAQQLVQERVLNAHSFCERMFQILYNTIQQHQEVIKREYSQNTTCVEKMVYSAIETICFGLYWPPSGFYNIFSLCIYISPFLQTAFAL
jgi:hypothetical protein